MGVFVVRARQSRYADGYADLYQHFCYLLGSWESSGVCCRSLENYWSQLEVSDVCESRLRISNCILAWPKSWLFSINRVKEIKKSHEGGDQDRRGGQTGSVWSLKRDCQQARHTQQALQRLTAVPPPQRCSSSLDSI